MAAHPFAGLRAAVQTLERKLAEAPKQSCNVYSIETLFIDEITEKLQTDSKDTISTEPNDLCRVRMIKNIITHLESITEALVPVSCLPSSVSRELDAQHSLFFLEHYTHQGMIDRVLLVSKLKELLTIYADVNKVNIIKETHAHVRTLLNKQMEYVAKYNEIMLLGKSINQLTRSVNNIKGTIDNVVGKPVLDGIDAGLNKYVHEVNISLASKTDKDKAAFFEELRKIMAQVAKYHTFLEELYTLSRVVPVCMLCRYAVTTHITVPCGHTLCKKCVTKHNNEKCPFCRTTIDKLTPINYFL